MSALEERLAQLEAEFAEDADIRRESRKRKRQAAEARERAEEQLRRDREEAGRRAAEEAAARAAREQRRSELLEEATPMFRRLAEIGLELGDLRDAGRHVSPLVAERRSQTRGEYERNPFRSAYEVLELVAAEIEKKETPGG